MRPNRLATSLVAVAIWAIAALGAVPSQAAAAPANRMVMWVNCQQLAGISDATLDAMHARGVGGFVCMSGWLRGMGGTEAFTGDLASLDGPTHTLERSLRDSQLSQRLQARGMKAYLGAYFASYRNGATPLLDWFDDSGWNGTALPAVHGLAAAARALGFAGVAFDTELYPGETRQATATWDWTYPGNTHSEASVRAQADARGRQVMSALLDAFPGIEVAAYDVQFPASWFQVVQAEVNHQQDAFGNRLDTDFWNGMTSVPGYGPLRFYDSTFYKTSHLADWDTALGYDYNSLFAYFSRQFSNWSYAASRVSVTPFAWIDAGPCSCSFDDARSPDYVAQQLAAFRKWAMDGEFADYAHTGLYSFDYTPYAGAMTAATSPAAVDSQPPSLAVDARRSGGGAVLTGSASDALAVRYVGWSAPGGRSGTAAMNWRVDSGAWQTRDIRSHMDWTARVPLVSGQNAIRVTAVDVKGLTTTRTVTVSGAAKARAARARRKAKRKVKRCRRAAAKSHARKARKAKGQRAKRARCVRARKHRA